MPTNLEIRPDSIVWSRFAQVGTALAVYTGLTIVFTWPLALHPLDTLATLGGIGDPYLNLWILGWNLGAFHENLGSLFTLRIFDANIFHPARQTLAFSDHLLVPSLAVWPIYALTESPVLAYNAVFFGSLVASAAAMHAYARVVTGSRWGAYAAGIVWAFAPYHFARLPHLQLQGLYFLPLTFLFMHYLIAGRRWSSAIGLGATAGLQTLTSVYYGVIGVIGLAVAGVTLMVTTGRQKPGLMLRRMVLAAVVGALVVAPVVWIYYQVQQREGFARTLVEAARHGAQPIDYLTVPRSHLLYGRTGLLPSDSGAEHELFLGFVAPCLAVFGFVVAWRRESRPLAITMAALAVTGLLLSFGPNLGSLYSLLHRTVFGFQAIRAPSRFVVLLLFGMATLVGVAVRELASQASGQSRRRALVWPIMALSLVGIEYMHAPLPLSAAPEVHAATGEWLQHAPAPGAVVYLPLSLDVGNTPFMIDSLRHRRPIVNGYSGQRPAFYPALVDSVSTFPSADAIWTLRDLDVRYVVSPTPIQIADWPLVERTVVLDPWRPGGQAFIYEIDWSEEAISRLAPEMTVEVPEPGMPPFKVGEVATYRAEWLGAGASLSAGEVTVQVVAPDGSGLPEAAYRFVVTAVTSPWVARFFEARDRFETVADPLLRPLRHERSLREGRRVVDRVVDYDLERQVATTRSPTADQDSLRSRFPAGARDPLSTLFFIRTLDLERYRALTVPVNELGRDMLVELGEPVVETITVAGASHEAFCYRPRLTQRVARRQSPNVRLWISRDERRLPLAVEMSADYGIVRLELSEYRAE